MPPQAPILASVPAFTRYLVFELAPSARAAQLAARLVSTPWGADTVVGVGLPLALTLGADVPGLRAFPALVGPGAAVPSTQGALFVSIEAPEATSVHDRARSLVAALSPELVLREEVLGWKYKEGRDLTGYLDGSENPKAGAAARAAIIEGRGPGLDGGSFVAVQRWLHDLRTFDALDPKSQNDIFGRDKATDEELSAAPPFAHVRRAAQESFEPPAFVLRRSMPWGGAGEHGLFFVAFGRSLAAFETILSRMVGADDGIVDGVFRFSRPLSGGYYFCPPVGEDGALDLGALRSSK